MIAIQLFLTFFKIGAFTFGGGYAMLPLIQQEVLEHQWMGLEELVNFMAVSESTPGPLAVNLSTYVGAETAGLGGAVCASLGVVLPSFLIILIVAKFFAAFRDNSIVQGCMSGLRPAVVGMIAAALVSVAGSVFPMGIPLPRLLAAVCLLALALLGHWKKLHPILILVLSAAAGVGLGYAGVLG